MIYESQNQQPAVNVYPNGSSGGYGVGDGFGGGAWWIIVLFLFAMFGGWGNNGNAAPAYGAAPYYGVQQGFDQAAVMGGLNGIQTSLANAEVSRANAQNTLAMALQQCCCENRTSIADLKYTVATENCADRSALSDGVRDIIANQNANTQAILDKMCQQEIDALKAQNSNLQMQLTMSNLAASQNAQTATILANNEAQTAALEQYLAPTPRPAYVVQNPNCCTSNYYSPCGCSAS